MLIKTANKHTAYMNYESVTLQQFYIMFNSNVCLIVGKSKVKFVNSKFNQSADICQDKKKTNNILRSLYGISTKYTQIHDRKLCEHCKDLLSLLFFLLYVYLIAKLQKWQKKVKVS